VLAKYQRDKSALIDILQDTQSAIGYLPREALEEIHAGLDVPLSRVYSVATFFKAFSLTPRGRHVINVCLGTACHVRGAPRIIEEITRQLKINPGETTPDGEFTLETVNCLGACALAPVVVIDDVYYEKVTPDRLRALINGCRNGGPTPAEAGAAPEPETEPQVPEPPPPEPRLPPGAPEQPGGPSKRKLRRAERKHKRKAKRRRERPSKNES